MAQRPTIMHLAKYLPAYTGGMEAVTAELATAGIAMGARVVIVGADPGQPSSPSLPLPEAAKAADSGIEQHALTVYGNLGPVPLAPSFFQLAPLLAQADVVHVHLPNPLAEAALLKYLLTTPKLERPKIVPIVHVAMVRWPLLGQIWEELMQKPLLRRSDLLIAATSELMQHLTSLHEMRDKTAILPFPTPPPVFNPLPRSSTTPELLVIGRLVPYKGFDLLLEALAALSQPWHLQIAGDGPQREALERQATALGIASRVVFHGRVDEAKKQQLLSSCDLFLAPSRTTAEAYGLVIAEAFSYGKAVITTDLPTGVAYLARGGQCGAAVPAGSVPHLTQALARMLTDPGLRRQCGSSNQEFWRSELTRERFAQRYQSTINALLGVEPERNLARAS